MRKSVTIRCLVLLMAVLLLMHAASAARIRKPRTLPDTPPCPHCEAYTPMLPNAEQPGRWLCKGCGQESEVHQWARNPALYDGAATP